MNVCKKAKEARTNELMNRFFDSCEETVTMDKNNYGHIHCPVNGWDCPYFDANGCCMMYPEFDPIEECDDFYSIWGDDEEADYICFENHTKGE